MPIVEIAKIQVRRGQENQTGVPQLDPGEMAWAEDTENLYIGKSINEGASNNNNSRILTDKDLNTFFNIASSAISVANSSTAYRYRSDLPYGNTVGKLLSTTSTYSIKLNNWVSLTDFAPNGVWPPFANDITISLQNAIGIISNTSYGGGVVYEKFGPPAIKIPAGTWNINSTVELPPNTVLIGDGPASTIITYSIALSTTNPMFETVDGLGNSYTQGMTYNNGSQASQVQIRDMGLQFPFSVQTSATLVSLDNVTNVLIKNVTFGSTAITTSSLVTNGIGLAIRSNLAVTNLGLSPCGNISIDNCIFQGVNVGISTVGAVYKYSVRNSKFSWLTNGIVSYANTVSGYLNCVNSLVENCTFDTIANEAIFIGTSTLQTSAYFTSQSNTFRNVGNNFINETSQFTPVIRFNDTSCVSNNDYIDRQYSSPSTTYHVPWISGSSTIIVNQGSVIKTATVAPGAVVTLAQIPLNIRSQSAKFEYNAYNVNMERSGKLEMDISTSGTNYTPDGSSVVGDSYSYSESSPGKSQQLVFSTDPTYSTLSYQCDANFSTYPYAYTQSTINAGTTTVTLILANPVGQKISNITTGMNITAVNLPPTGLFPGTYDVGTTATDVAGAFSVGSTATVAGYSIAGNQITVKFNTATIAPIPTGAVFVFTTATLVTWQNDSTFNFLAPLDPYGNINVLAGTNPNLAGATLRVNGGQHSYAITGTTYLPLTSSYLFQFYASPSLTIHPEDTVEVMLNIGNYKNYTALVCQNLDTTPTTVEYTLKSLTV